MGCAYLSARANTIYAVMFVLEFELGLDLILDRNLDRFSGDYVFCDFLVSCGSLRSIDFVIFWCLGEVLGRLWRLWGSLGRQSSQT